MTLADAEAFAVAQGWPRFRGEQVWRWVHDKGARTFDEMTNLPRDARAELAERAQIGSLTVAEVQTSQRRHAQAAPRHARRSVDRERDHPRRREDHAVHLVAGRLRGRLPVLRDREARPQAQPRRRRDRRPGLPRAAPARRGRARPQAHEPRLHGDGRAAPQLRQHGASRCASSRTTRARSSRSAASRCRRRASCPSSRSSAPRTCGPNLAVSLNAPNDEIRDEIMPINRKWNIGKLLAALARIRSSSAAASRSSTCCSPASTTRCATRRSSRKLLRGIKCKVNIIPCNPHPEAPYAAPDAGGDRRVPERVQAARPADLPAHAARRRHRRRVRPAREPQQRRGDRPAARAQARQRPAAAAAGRLRLARRLPTAACRTRFDRVHSG